MKRIALLFAIAFTIILAAACGGPAPTPTQAPVATEAPVQPAATEVPPQQPTAAESDPLVNGTQVDITLADNTIDASLTTFQVGVPYTFVVKNTGTHPHNFNISTPVAQAGSLDAALKTALLAVPRNQLGPGASVTVQFTFHESAAGQQLEFSCLIQRHYSDGMLLGITVTN